jgi:hypothetical protein
MMVVVQEAFHAMGSQIIHLGLILGLIIYPRGSGLYRNAKVDMNVDAGEESGCKSGVRRQD